MRIGLEVHCGLDTESKLFCACSARPSPEERPNSRCCPVCLGHPGSRPLTNSRAVSHALRVALALGCRIPAELRFARKSYFYPDLPKNFQITQYDHPLGGGGTMETSFGSVALRRIHLEEDPGAIVDRGSYVLVDYNRSGCPLLEIVTEPALKNAEEARAFVDELSVLLGCLVVYSPERNILKVDANISLSDVRVEIKNILGQRELQRALEYEEARQRETIARGEAIVQETRHWDAALGATKPMRSKESEDDYGYIEEPDLVPHPLEKGWLAEVRKALPELPLSRSRRLVKQYRIAEDDSRIICFSGLADAFETIAGSVDPVLAARWTRREVLRVLNLRGERVISLELLRQIASLLALVEKKKVTDAIAKELLEKLFEKPFDVKTRVGAGLSVVMGDELRAVCERVVKENQKAVSDYQSGRPEALDFLLGQVMRATKGRADPGAARLLLKELGKA